MVSCASYNVTSHGESFTSYKSDNSDFARMRNEGSFKIMGIRDVFIEIITVYKYYSNMSDIFQISTLTWFLLTD